MDITINRKKDAFFNRLLIDANMKPDMAKTYCGDSVTVEIDEFGDSELASCICACIGAEFYYVEVEKENMHSALKCILMDLCTPILHIGETDNGYGVLIHVNEWVIGYLKHECSISGCLEIKKAYISF